MEIPRWEGWPHVLETQQFSVDVLEPLMEHMRQVEDNWTSEFLRPRISQPFSTRRRLTFYRDEASTRTEATFREAGIHLGYDVYLVLGPLSSALKGESIEDLGMALTQVGGMAHRLTDMFVIRSKEDGAAHRVAKAIDDANRDGNSRSLLPVLNAGDGEDQHPTQGFVDLRTLYRERKCIGHPLEDITLVMAGDISHSRTINSLCHLLGRFSPQYRIRIIFCSHPAIGPKEGMIGYLNRHEVAHEVREDFAEAIREADAVYMTRIQRERFTKEEENLYRQAKGTYMFKKEYLELLKPGAFVMHPLPINNDPKDPPPEIDLALAPLARRNHPQCVWGRQSHRGLFVRYALLDIIEAGIQRDMGLLPTA